MTPEREEAMQRLREASQAAFPPPPPEIAREHQRQVTAWKVRRRRWERRTGVTQADVELSKAYAENTKILQAMGAMPAVSLAGLKAKAEAWSDGDFDQPELAQAIIDDLRRLPEV